MASFSLKNTLFSSLTNVFSSRLQRMNNGCLDHLSDDILIDHIFFYLDVEDVLAMRRVSKLYYYLTHQPIIWKRFLRLINLPLPPLPPTSRYTYGSLTCLEAERLVIRAITLDDNWRSEDPILYRYESMFTHAEVLSMTVLPGGKYLVASVRDPGHYRYSLMVFILDRPTGAAIPLARAPTGTKAYNIQAKYMAIDGVQGIAIAYVCRDFIRQSRETTGLDPSDFSVVTDIDTPVPFRYECVCLHIYLTALEKLGECRYPPGSEEFLEHAKAQPPPFRMLCKIRSKIRLETVNLDEIDGAPYVSVVRYPETLIFRDLNLGTKSTMYCERWNEYSDTENIICNFRILPNQKQILVIRKIIPTVVNEKPLYPVELFEFPRAGTDIRSRQLDRILLDNLQDDEEIASFQISDPNVPSRYNLAEGLKKIDVEPPPIQIFYRITNPNGLVHVTLWPRFVNPQNPNKYYYPLDNLAYQAHYDFSCSHVAHALPGSHRSLIYTVPDGNRTIHPPLNDIFSYINPGIYLNEPDVITQNTSQTKTIMKERRPARENSLAFATLSTTLAQKMQDGVMTIAWDEAIGRVCVAAKSDHHIWILDFAKAPALDEAGQRLPVPLADERMLEQ